MSSRFCSRALLIINRNTSYKYELLYVKSLPSSSASGPALDLVATALRLPNVFDFDVLFRIDAVAAAKGTELFALLQIYLNDGLTEYKAWEQKHGDTIAKYSEFGLNIFHGILELAI